MKKTFFKKILAVSLVSMFSVQMLFTLIEPRVAIAATAADNVVVTLTVDQGITITTPADVTMGAITAAVNGSTGSAVWTVKTNNATGYDLFVKASSSPALVSGGNSFADYTEASNGTPEVWNTGASTTEFGYSAYGTDTATATWGTSATCGTATTPDAAMKYVGFETTDKAIATKATVTGSSGVATTICFAAEQDGIFAPSGTYTATITATATTK